MNLFDPRTFSTDWEVMVVDKLERCVETEKLMAFAGALARASDHPVKIDWNTLEFAMGINASLDQIWNRIQKVTDRASQLVREYDLELFPAGAHPVERLFNSSHIHVGTIHDEGAAIALEHVLFRYAPAFGALAANSPLTSGRQTPFKSARIRYQANGCTTPMSLRDPHTAQPEWGGDVCPKLYGAPTLEIRITDCASSRRLVAELATFVAAFLHMQGTKGTEYRLTPDEYRQCLLNRWAAARHGLQATFVWDGQATPVTEVLSGMLDECREALSALGASRSDLGVINGMLQKRTCQADFVRDLAARYPDPFVLASVYAKLVRHWTVFEEYLETAATLDPVAPLDDEAILAEHRDAIGEGTYFYKSREVMYLPPPLADRVIDQLVELGHLRREVTEKRGTLLSRT